MGVLCSCQHAHSCWGLWLCQPDQAWVLEGVLGLVWTASGEARPDEHQGCLSQLRLLQQNTTYWVV